VLNHDGADLTATLQTTRQIADHAAPHIAVDHTPPDSRLEIANQAGHFGIALLMTLPESGSGTHLLIDGCRSWGEQDPFTY
jgi:hypothetical protein